MTFRPAARPDRFVVNLFYPMWLQSLVPPIVLNDRFPYFIGGKE